MWLEQSLEWLMGIFQNRHSRRLSTAWRFPPALEKRLRQSSPALTALFVVGLVFAWVRQEGVPDVSAIGWPIVAGLLIGLASLACSGLAMSRFQYLSNERRISALEATVLLARGRFLNFFGFKGLGLALFIKRSAKRYGYRVPVAFLVVEKALTVSILLIAALVLASVERVWPTFVALGALATTLVAVGVSLGVVLRSRGLTEKLLIGNGNTAMFVVLGIGVCLPLLTVWIIASELAPSAFLHLAILSRVVAILISQIPLPIPGALLTEGSFLGLSALYGVPEGVALPIALGHLIVYALIAGVGGVGELVGGFRVRRSI